MAKVKEPKEKNEKKIRAPKEPKNRKPREKKTREPKEKTEKPKFMDRFKKKINNEDDGFDIITDVKEPFSFANFFETHVIERAKRIKNILAEKGILFFLTSPFQAKGRLIAQMLLLCVGIGFGVIPRASSLVSALQNQAYESEIAGLTSKYVGNINITPAASSNYKKHHMIAFIIEGDNLPSDASKYEVHLAKSYGASDWKNVTYSYTVYPVTDEKRILIVNIDQSKQPSGYGAFQLYIQMAGEEVKDYAKTPFEITLSTAQKTTDLYNKTGIHLSVLTKMIGGNSDISKKEAEFEDALKEYQTVLEQAQAMPIDLTVSPTVDDLEAICLSNRVYRTLTDDSTTEDILSIEPVTTVPDIKVDTVLTSNGIKYDSSVINTLQNGDTDENAPNNLSDEDMIIFDTFKSVDDAKEQVISAMENVNTEAMLWYDTLTRYKLILNQTIYPESFPFYARCTNTIEDPIDYIDQSEFLQPATEDPGLSSKDIGDTEIPKTPPVIPVPPEEPEEPKTSEEPVTPEEPAETEKPEKPKEETPAADSGTNSETSGNSSTNYFDNFPATTTGDPADSK